MRTLPSTRLAGNNGEEKELVACYTVCGHSDSPSFDERSVILKCTAAGAVTTMDFVSICLIFLTLWLQGCRLFIF